MRSDIVLRKASLFINSPDVSVFSENTALVSPPPCLPKTLTEMINAGDLDLSLHINILEPRDMNNQLTEHIKTVCNKKQPYCNATTTYYLTENVFMELKWSRTSCNREPRVVLSRASLIFWILLFGYALLTSCSRLPWPANGRLVLSCMKKWFGCILKLRKF